MNHSLQTGHPILFALHCLLITILLTACAPKPAGPQPPEIIYGQDICEACGMIISEAQYAAATLVENSDPRKFESISDMVVYHMDHPEQKVEAWFVHDYTTETWIRAEAAFYVLSERIQSPMPPGLAAFEREADAEAFAVTVGGAVLSFDEMRGQVHVTAHG